MTVSLIPCCPSPVCGADGPWPLTCFVGRAIASVARLLWWSCDVCGYASASVQLPPNVLREHTPTVPR